jgi:hypothetical protein
MSEGLTRDAFGKAVGLSPARITTLCAEGLPSLDDGRIDEAAGRQWIPANLDSLRRADRKRATGATETAAHLRRLKLQREGELLALELRKRSGELVPKAAAEAAIFGRARFERDRWTGWIARAAPALAAKLGTDPAVTFGALDKAVRDHLAELARTPWAGLGDD